VNGAQRPTGMTFTGFETYDFLRGLIDENTNALGFADNRSHDGELRVIRHRRLGQRLRWSGRSRNDRGRWRPPRW
jgi:hypothetical protein